MIPKNQAAGSSDGGSEPAPIHMTVCPPCDWQALFGFLASRAIPGVEHVADGIWRRSIALHGRVGTIEAARIPGVDAVAVFVRPADVLSPSQVSRRLIGVFDARTDPQPIAATLSRDPLLASRVATRPGLRVPGAWDTFELAVRAILGQQITVVGAGRLAGLLVAAFGDKLPAAMALPGVTHLFPTADRLAESDVASLGLPRVRAATIRRLAAAVAADPALLHPTDSLDADIVRLCRLPGIGPWTAHYIAMRGLRHADAFPAADIGLMRAATPPGGARPTPAQLLARVEGWRPYRAYGAMHLWTANMESTWT